MTDPARSDLEAAVAAASGRFRSHGGGVQLLRIEHGTVQLGFTGACQGCPCRAQCLESTVVPLVEAVPDVIEVEARGVRIDAEARRRLRGFLGSAPD